MIRSGSLFWIIILKLMERGCWIIYTSYPSLSNIIRIACFHMDYSFVENKMNVHVQNTDFNKSIKG